MQSSNGRPRGGGDGVERSFDNHDGQDPACTDAVGSSGNVRYDDPWYDALASGWGESDGVAAGGPEGASARQERETPAMAAADVYLEVQRSAAFQEVRRRYRRFVIPAGAAFFAWYVAYVVTATTAPGLMARPVAGAVNVAMVAGLGQFLTTFLLTWAYARHARLRRDRAALELRWDTQELTRGVRGGAS
ncbi:DUF485 domain-containing protein [Streptomyces sp. YU58]|uniref:DUF485 domain-containing protein n=1 Tax=Streptomyces sp. SX92 TaxID=3158972 RepID=UPI0027B9BC36|nr:DUF485 domain-containing protein [Streptomyces coralus]WLW51723.1 DUF485 domain-containing protein [Streptomyces coralus]